MTRQRCADNGTALLSYSIKQIKVKMKIRATLG